MPELSQVPDAKQPLPIWGQSGQRVKPGLYVVATPIGNLRDITLRALDILSAADVVYCEDTRVTGRLLSAYGISKKLERCDEHTEKRRADEIIAAIRDGKIIVFASDAGTPGISDPGTALIAACHQANALVSPVPGPSAAIAAMSVAGVEQTGNFLFLGFLPPKSGARRRIFHDYLSLDATLVLYEAPQRIKEMLSDIHEIIGPREIIIARELTKLHEQFYRGTPEELVLEIDHANFKGEVVVLILPGTENETAWNDEKIDQALTAAMADLSLKEAVAQVSSQSGISRKIIYARALQLNRHET
ncbi:MAG: rRNA methyltransferase [Alphaproteobacteria bacterium]|nr:rRNA methyltransferase [Alphaproteobacteria bacterium]